MTPKLYLLYIKKNNNNNVVLRRCRFLTLSSKKPVKQGILESKD